MNQVFEKNDVLLLAIGSKSRTGKDTIADYVIERYGGVRLSFASALYDIANYSQTRLGKKVEKVPLLLQKQGEALKEVYGRDVWAKCLEQDIIKIMEQDKKTNIIVTDLRFPEEYNLLTGYGFKTVRVNRKDRPITRDPNHISETALESFNFDYEIQNDGDLSDLKNETYKMCEHFGF